MASMLPRRSVRQAPHESLGPFRGRRTVHECTGAGERPVMTRPSNRSGDHRSPGRRSNRFVFSKMRLCLRRMGQRRTTNTHRPREAGVTRVT